MRIAAAVIAASLLVTGCFPHNAKYRTYSKWGEGGAIVSGVLIEALTNTGADCDMMGGTAQPDSSCHSTAKVFGTAGLVLIVGGLLGFVATVSTSEDEDDNKKSTTVVQKAVAPAETAAAAAATGIGPGSAAPGSGAAPKSAP